MSFKEIKARIASVKSTRKITSAMRLVSTIKLKKSQRLAETVSPYAEELDKMMKHLLSTGSFADNSLLVPRTVKRVAVVAFSANNSLCGGFNSNMIRHFNIMLEQLQQECEYKPIIFPVGEKISFFAKKMGLEIDSTFVNLAEKQDMAQASELSNRLLELYLQGICDKVIITYTHFKSVANQVIVDRTFLPVIHSNQEIKKAHQSGFGPEGIDYIFEPSAKEIFNSLLPISLKMKIYSAAVESYVSEQAARVVAMRMATDNADKLVDELVLKYNKTRQQAITNELLDIFGGTVR